MLQLLAHAGHLCRNMRPLRPSCHGTVCMQAPLLLPAHGSCAAPRLCHSCLHCIVAQPGLQLVLQWQRRLQRQRLLLCYAACQVAGSLVLMSVMRGRHLRLYIHLHMWRAVSFADTFISVRSGSPPGHAASSAAGMAFVIGDADCTSWYRICSHDAGQQLLHAGWLHPAGALSSK